MRAALGDLRVALARPLALPPIDTGATLRGELERLGRHYKELPLEVDWAQGAEVPRELESLAQSVFAEALRNAQKHARPSRVTVRVGTEDGAFVLEVRNDGVGEPGNRGAAGMGLRLAAMEALGRGGVVEFGRERGGDWRVRLVVPLS
jgi:signal transduction histidine kinase